MSVVVAALAGGALAAAVLGAGLVLLVDPIAKALDDGRDL